MPNRGTGHNKSKAGEPERIESVGGARNQIERPPIVVIDACVWHGAFARHVIRHVALQGLLRLRWTRSIEAEWLRSIRNARPDIPITRLVDVREQFRREFPEGLLPERLPRERLPPLPDPDDAHVVHAALQSKASFICTVDRRGFPRSTMKALGIAAITPDALVTKLLQQQAHAAVRALRTHRLGLNTPAMSAAEYIGALRKAGLPRSARHLKQHIHDL